MKLSLEEKIKVIEYAIMETDRIDHTNFFMCNSIDRGIYKLFPDKVKGYLSALDIIPEIQKYEPKDMPLVWFETNADGFNKRCIILNSLLKDLNNKLNK